MMMGDILTGLPSPPWSVSFESSLDERIDGFFFARFTADVIFACGWVCDSHFCEICHHDFSLLFAHLLPNIFPGGWQLHEISD